MWSEFEILLFYQLKQNLNKSAVEDWDQITHLIDNSEIKLRISDEVCLWEVYSTTGFCTI